MDETTAPSTVAESGNAIGPERHVILTGDVTREVQFLSNDYTNPTILSTLALTLADHHDAFESFSAPVFCDFVRNYSCTVDGAVVTSKLNAFDRPSNYFKTYISEYNFRSVSEVTHR